jgi:hypothetical protein
VNYRMPYVGTVALHGHQAEVLSTTRVAASAGDGPAAIVERLFDEVIATQRVPRRLPS